MTLVDACVGLQAARLVSWVSISGGELRGVPRRPTAGSGLDAQHSPAGTGLAQCPSFLACRPGCSSDPGLAVPLLNLPDKTTLELFSLPGLSLGTSIAPSAPDSRDSCSLEVRHAAGTALRPACAPHPCLRGWPGALFLLLPRAPPALTELGPFPRHPLRFSLTARQPERSRDTELCGRSAAGRECLARLGVAGPGLPRSRR